MPAFRAFVVLALLGLLLAACPSPISIRDAGAGASDDAGSSGSASCGNLPVGPPCCNAVGDRLMSADCDDTGEWSCEEGELCECEGEGASFICSDACGSDAFAEPTCEAGGWSCGGLVRSDSCPDDLCWGDPGDCCVNPSCVDGAWECQSIQDPCE